MTDAGLESPPGRRIVLAVVAFVGGLLVASIVGAIVIEAGGWVLDVPVGLGSEAGRAAMQVGNGLPLDDMRVPAAVLALLNVPLWLALVGLPLLDRRTGLDWRRHLGWAMAPIDVPMGLAVGVVTQFALIPMYELVFLVFGEFDVGDAAERLVATVNTPLDVVALVVMTVVVAPIAEEIVFRGLLFGGVRDLTGGRWALSVPIAVAVSSAVFALSHFQLPQFPGLFLFGVVAAMLCHRTGRLGTAVWAHVGFNLTTVVLLLG